MAGQVPGGDSHAVGRIGELLRTHGLRRTVPRIAVLVAIEPIKGHLSVADIHQRLLEATADDAHAPDLATVYRTVTTLVEHGVLHALTVESGTTTYGLAKDAHHHAVCTRCGDVIEIPASRLARALRNARAASSFALSDEAGLTLHGLCPRCQNAQ
ncbi:MAG: transcriptional repressor [Mycolicibacterium sp.]|uniref:Fur family transcriptional regulator n=1 Tax=Mycolicibacterium sp. TaxID=2320850 RepID=UPI000FA5D110|nr:Fur family transcriptional regulator [Mycolicibacterium sp.]RUP28033.1 MAG: transcriptional repressor [Mycolicibacterium sp.]